MVVEHKYFVGYQYVDANFKIKNSAILGMFEDLACIHGGKAGEDIRYAPTVWILTAYKVDIKRRPEYGEYVNVRTWSRSLRGFLAFREFEIRDAEGELLVSALSEWAHIQRAEVKPARVTPELEAAYESEPERTNFAGVRLRSTKEPQEYESVLEYTVGRNWVDVNRHMNNIYYAELAEAALPDGVFEDIAQYGFEIYYRKEIKYGQNVKCFYAEEGDMHTVTVKSEDGEILHALIRYTK